MNGCNYAQCATPQYLKAVQFSSVNLDPLTQVWFSSPVAQKLLAKFSGIVSRIYLKSRLPIPSLSRDGEGKRESRFQRATVNQLLPFYVGDRSHAPRAFWIGSIPDKFYKVTTQVIQKLLISVYTGFVKEKYHILYNAVENVPIYGAGNLNIRPRYLI